MNTKPIICCLAALASFGHFASAEVDLEQIPGDANWLLHFDVTSIQSTQLWAQLGEEQFRLFIEENDIPLNPDKLIDVVKTVTLHGSSFDMDDEFNGVMLIQGTPELSAIVEALILSFVEPPQDEPATDSTEPVEPTAETPYPVYPIGDDVTIALLSDSRVAISKSRARIAHCVEVMAGDEPNLVTSNNLGDFESPGNSFFQVAATAGVANGSPPPALERVLRMIEGLQLTLGENDHSVVVEIAARAKTEEIAQELSKVVEGLSTLTGIADPENEILVALTESIVVQTAGQRVGLSARYPVEAVVEAIRAMQPPPFETLIGDDTQGGDLLKMHLTASSIDSEYLSSNTLDGNHETRWAAQGKSHWLRFELAQESSISGVGIAWYMGDTRKRYVEVDLSRDGTDWTTVYRGLSSGKTTEFEQHVFEPESARWVQFRFENDDETTWHSVNEIELTGSNTVIVSSNSSMDNVSSPANATDGDLDTRWSEFGEAWLLYELDTPSVIQDAGIAWYQGNTRKGRFELQVSDDRQSWTTILRHESNGKSLDLEQANTMDTPARWVKLIGLGNSSNDWTSITNFELYGVPAD